MKPTLPTFFSALVSKMSSFKNLSALVVLLFSGGAWGQITVAGASTGNGNYTTLGGASGAFTAINSAIGTITISITGNVSESTSATLTNTFATSITISPSGGAARTISGAITAGSPLIDFSGADNVTINGLNTGGNSLTISNTTVSTATGTATIRFISGATNNTITNCSVLGSSTMAVGTNGGNIYFATDAVTANGNDNNTISNCNIGPAGANLPTKGIYGNGSTTTTAIGNSGITITNNNIYDYFGAAVESAGIYTAGGCNTWSITNNKFYQTGTRTWTTGAQHSAIWLLSSSATRGMVAATITGNTIGYASNTQTGTYTLTGSTGKFIGIMLTAITGGTSSTISSNTIASVSLTGVSSSGNSNTSFPFAAIYISNGVATTNSNTIGSQSATGSITFSSSSTSSSDVYGIYNYSSDNWTANSNNIGGITATNTSTGGANIYGIRSNTGSTVTSTLQSNTIGGTIANSIQSTSSNASPVNGILNTTSVASFSDNTIKNLTSLGNVTGIVNSNTTNGNIFSNKINTLYSSNGSTNVTGISNTAGSTVNIYGNTINTLLGTGTNSPTANGISVSGGTTVNVYKNKIYDILESGAISSTSGAVNGILISGGTTVSTYNNLIGDLRATAATLPDAIRGISITSTIAASTYNVYFNTVYLNASSSGTTFGTTGIFHTYNVAGTVANLVMRNNIVVNTSTPGSSAGLTVAFRRNAATDLTNYSTTSNNNLFYAGTPGAAKLIYYDGTNSDQTLAAFKARVTTRETSSISENPTFTSTTGSNSGFLHLDTTVYSSTNNNAGTGTGITDDYDADARSGSTPDIGADEFTGSCSPTQPTSLVLTPTGANINGSFTAATTGAGGYLVVRTDDNTQPSPTNGTTYTVGSADMGAGTYVVASGTATTFASSSLTGGTTYYYWVFSFSTNCATTPTYIVTSVLTNSAVAPTPCSTPTAQPTTLVLTATSASTVSGSFTAASPAASAYLVVRSTSNTEVSPVNGTTYTVGSATFGAGTYVEAAGTAVSFSSTGLVGGTPYYYFVYSYATACTGEPYYVSATSTPAIAALTNSVTTMSCPAPGTYTVGPTGTYTSITQVINTLAGCSVSGAVLFELQAAYNSNVETFPITFPVIAGSSGTNTVTFRPETGATNLSITSSNATGTLNFNAGSNIVFDGRPGGTGTAKELTIENTNVGTSYAVQFINDASSNTIKYCKVRSANTSTTSGTIVFSTTTATTGNDNNAIDNNDIYDAAAGTPTIGIYALGTTAKDNNSNTISNNNIYNFFNATSDMFGVNILANNSDWTLNSNSLYQTATRNLTGSNSFTGIQINSNTNNNMTFSSNYIGGQAPLAAGSALTITGSGNFGAAIRMTVGTTTASNVQGNVIKNISITSSSTSASNLINLPTGKINCGTTTGNTIGSQSSTGSITVSLTGATFFNALQAGSGTAEVMNIYNNTIGGIDVSGSALAAVRGITIQGTTGTFTVNANTIGSTTTSNSITNSNDASTTGISGTASLTSATQTISNNTIANITASGTLTGNVVRGIAVAGTTGGIYSTINNTIFNLSSATTAIGTNSAASIIGINATAATTAGQTVSGNTIYNLSNTQTGATISGIVGIYYSGPTTGTNVVSKNFVHSISLSSNLVTSIITGIFSAAGLTTYHNNMIRLGNNTTAVGYIIRGINDFAGTAGYAYYFNSVYIGGTGVATGGSNTFAFTTTPSTARTIKNNIFFNARSNAAGSAKHYAISVTSGTGLTSNNNDFYVNGTGGVLGSFAAADVTDLVAWRTASVQDANSKSWDPQFITPEGSSTTVNLHINASNPTPIEGTGIAISGILDDIDGDVRANFTATDMGADAGNFTASLPNDIAAVSFVSPINGGTQAQNIDFTPQASFINNGTATQTSVTVRYKIIDSGSNEVYNQTATISSLAADISSTVSFPSTTITSTGVYTIQAIAELSGDATISNDQINGSITIEPQLAGDYLVGSSQSAPYNTITNAIAKLNSVGVSAAVRFLLTDATYSISETFPITINAISGASGTNTFTIKPNTSVTAAISGSATSALIKIASKYVTIDGSNSVNGTSRDLTITNTSTTTPSVILIGNSGTSTVTALTDVTLKNAILINGANTSNAVIVANNLAAAGYFNNITIQNNSVQKAYIGIYALATATTGNGSGLLITGNDLNATSPNALTYTGIFVQGVDGATVSNNNIANITSSTVSPNGVVFYTGTNSGSISGNTISALSYTGTYDNAPSGIISTATTATNILIYNNIISNISSSAAEFTYSPIPSGIYISSINTSAYNNKISNIKQTNSGGEPAFGINLSSASTTSGISVYNNFIFDIAGYGYSASSYFNGYGIGLLSGGGYNLYNNTINMNTNQTTGVTSAIYIYSSLVTAGSVNIRNNIFANTQTGGATAANRYAIYCAAANTIFGTINYNNYYSAATNLGYLGSARTNLADIVTGFGGNANSISAIPTFTSATDLHLTAVASASGNAALKAGTPISGITTDYDGETRNTVTPAIGADEIFINGFWSGATSTVWDASVTGNWDDGTLPASGADIVVPAGVSNSPVLTSVSPTIGKLDLGTGKTLTLGANTLTINGAVSGSGTITGGSTSNLTIGGTAGTLNFTTGSRSLNNLSLGASGVATLGTGLDIYGVLGFTTGGSLNMNDKSVSLKSSASATARVSDLTGSTLTGATNVTVERFIPGKRAWRALTAPVIGSTNNSIFYNWQNNGTITAGVGVELWSTSTTGGNGMGTGPSNSILKYNNSGTTGAWDAITNTNSNYLFDANINDAFMVFVTGPYATTSTNLSSGFANTTLKAKGQLITGTKTYLNLPSGVHTLIGNPYASPLSPSSLLNDNSSSFGNNLWVWDASAAGNYSAGAYNIYEKLANTYTNITNSDPFGTSPDIQSGQAFFVKASSGTATFTISESNKGSAISNSFLRTAAPELFRVGLYKQENNQWSGRDGAITVIFSEANANQDPNKMANGTENIAFTKNGALYASNYHLPLVSSDVLNIRVWKTTAGANYKLKINTEQFATTNLDATLEDLFTNARTPLSLDGSAVEYPFTVTTDALSTGDRFRIVFQTSTLGTTIPTATSFSIVPNPVTGDSFQVNLGTLATGSYSYSICNAIGQEVEKGSINTTTQNTNYTVKFRETAATGIYIMKIKGSDNSVFTAKLIKK